MKKLFLFLATAFFLVSCSPKYILVTGAGATQEKQVVTTTTTTTQPTRVVYTTTQSAQQESPRRKRGGVALSFQYGESNSPFGNSRMIGGGIAIGNTSISANVGNNMMYRGQMYPQQRYYSQQRVVYPNYGYQQRGYYGNYNQYYNPYGYNNYYRPLYDQYGRPYPPGSNPAWGYTVPPNNGILW